MDLRGKSIIKVLVKRRIHIGVIRNLASNSEIVKISFWCYLEHESNPISTYQRSTKKRVHIQVTEHQRCKSQPQVS